MSHQPVLFLRLNNEVRGPFGKDQLRELAELWVITPATEVSESAAGPWTRIQEAAGCADVFRERPQYQFKAKEFAKLNLDTTPPVDHRDLIAAANRGRSTAPGFYPPAASKSPTTVEEVLKLNREREHAAGLDVLKPMPRVINRRRRDYLIVLIGGNLVFYFGLNAISGPAVGGLMAFFYTIGITWVMYGVMDKY
ncbi:MAG: hypothetical protein ABSG50_08705 [Opitutaceae bacterium]|jgi:hypothetical protein